MSRETLLPLVDGPAVGRPAAGPSGPGQATAPATHRSAYIETYGCQMNAADSELVAAVLAGAGYRIVDRPEAADVVLLNTCAVRENAESRVLGRAAQLSGLRAGNPGLTLGILGCMAQRLAAELPTRAPYVDLVAGPDSYQRLPAILAQPGAEPLLDVRLSRTENYVGISPVRRQGTNAWVTIIRGCDKFCTFCIVPYVRGRERSVPAAEVVRQVEQIAAAGYPEVTLLGQTVNSYDDGEVGFAELLRRVAAVEGIARVRFTSPYPRDFGDATIEAMATIPEVCPALHLPVQSGSEDQLLAMRRGYTVGQYRDLVRRLRAAIPDLAVTTDIIVGFCGETEADFDRTLALMEELRFEAAFMFRYSQRSGTHAARHLADDVPEATKIARLERVIELQEGISLEKNRDLVGRQVEVLVEGPSRRRDEAGEPTWYGRSAHFKVTVFPEEAAAGALVRVAVDQASSHTLFGHLVPG
ncbi:MAG: tRNA (N6-isopentenyl adenosine(37)-C2)-methylthiotransferase MiaB [Gemmatimonadota bacterium]